MLNHNQGEQNHGAANKQQSLAGSAVGYVSPGFTRLVSDSCIRDSSFPVSEQKRSVARHRREVDRARTDVDSLHCRADSDSTLMEKFLRSRTDLGSGRVAREHWVRGHGAAKLF